MLMQRIRRKPRADRTWYECLVYSLTPFIPPACRGLTLGSCRALARAAVAALWALLLLARDLPHSTKAKTCGCCAAWALAVRWEAGAPFFLCSVLAGMLLNLDDRADDQLSAYSIFNENFTRLLGQITAEQLIAEAAGGGLAVAAAAGNVHVGGLGGRGGHVDGNGGERQWRRRRDHTRGNAVGAHGAPDTAANDDDDDDDDDWDEHIAGQQQQQARRRPRRRRK